MTATPHPIWTPTTPDERRHVGVANLVALVMSRPEGHRYASAYGILAGLVTSTNATMRNDWAPAFAREIEHAMAEHPFDHGRRGEPETPADTPCMAPTDPHRSVPRCALTFGHDGPHMPPVN